MKDRRAILIGLIHKAAAQLGLDDEARRDLQKRLTGQASCRDMSERQLAQVAWWLKGRGADIGIPAPKAKGGQGFWHPTRRQWFEIERLCSKLGWDGGLDAPQLVSFVQRTAKVDDPRFLTRRQATDVIVGLRRWLRERTA